LPSEGDDGRAPGRLTGGMELIAAVLLAAPLGYLSRTPRLGLLRYLAVWLLIIPVQTIIVFDAQETSGWHWDYWAVNAIILALGIGLNRLGARLAQRRGRYAAA
jgi:hypothetical protein